MLSASTFEKEMATAGGRVVPGFDGCWVKLDMAAERRRSDTEQHEHEQHRAQSTEHRAPGENEKKGRGAERVGIYIYIIKLLSSRGGTRA